MDNHDSDDRRQHENDHGHDQQHERSPEQTEPPTRRPVVNQPVAPLNRLQRVQMRQSMRKSVRDDAASHLQAKIQFQGSPNLSEADAVKRTAANGLQGATTGLPHQQQIQKSFGKHDISGVRSVTGGDAEKANAQMGSLAFASGDAISFKNAPSLHTAAHEAAHIVQQRGGVQLKSGIGQVGDQYEVHADQVADQVVQGKSAESLLDKYAASGARSSVGGPVQHLKLSEEIVKQYHKEAEDLVHGPSSPVAKTYGLGSAKIVDITPSIGAERLFGWLETGLGTYTNVSGLYRNSDWKTNEVATKLQAWILGGKAKKIPVCKGTFVETSGINGKFHYNFRIEVSNQKKVGTGKRTTTHQDGTSDTDKKSKTTSTELSLTGDTGKVTTKKTPSVTAGGKLGETKTKDQEQTFTRQDSDTGLSQMEDWEATMTIKGTIREELDVSGSDYVNPVKWLAYGMEGVRNAVKGGPKTYTGALRDCAKIRYRKEKKMAK